MVEFEPDNEVEEIETDETPRRSWREIYASWPNWGRNLGKVVAGLVILVVLVLIGRSIHHHSESHNTANSGSGTSQQTAKAPSKQPGASSNSSPGSSSSTTSGGSSSSSSTPPATSGKSQSASTSQVPNTGPGDVAAIFVGSSLLAGGAHYLIRPRRSRP